MYDSVYIYMYILNYCFHERASFFSKKKQTKKQQQNKTKLINIYTFYWHRKKAHNGTRTYNIDYKHDSTVN